jgi:hypothetical protein
MEPSLRVGLLPRTVGWNLQTPALTIVNFAALCNFVWP